MKTFFNYLKDVRGEMKHVSWPTRRQATAYSLLVIGISLFVAALLGAFDFIFTGIAENFIF
ncbi:preprotein translocase subunit SecE [Candidatus Wolfebacteria bacterium]|nr:preprotein translocase subunit SecE [Candidatus Wolfebacteria bacterium]